MAILNNLHDFEGRIGNIVAYKRRDSNKTYLRIKGGVSKQRIKNDKAFKGTREVNAEWGGCAKASALVRNLFLNHQTVADFNLSSPLTAIAKAIQLRDTSHQSGERAILFSQFGHILEGFQLNRKNTFESVIRGNVSVQFNRTESKLIVHLPELIPGISFIPPTKSPVFNINVTFGTIPDLFYFSSGYAITGNDTTHQQLITNHVTPWSFIGNHLPAKSFELTLSEPKWMQPNELLAAIISINFGTPVTNELIKINKHVGAGKILKVDLRISDGRSQMADV